MTGQTEINKPPLLFLPGWGFDRRMLVLLSKLEGRRVIAPPSFLDPTTISNDILALLNHHQIEQVAISGWSMGAGLALDFTALHGDRVKSLELMALRKQWPVSYIQHIRDGIRTNIIDYLADSYRKYFIGYPEAFQRFSCRIQEDYLKELPTHITALNNGLDYLENYQPQRPPAHIPVHLIHGRQDKVAPVDEMVDLPTARITILKKGGHMTPWDIYD